MKVALIYRVNIASPDNVGVVLKMNGQQNALTNMGHDCIAYYHRDGDIIKRNQRGTEEIITTVTYRRRSFSFKDFFNQLSSESEIGSSDLIYIRYPFSTPAFLNFIRRFKKEQVIIELPTYPYDGEWTGFSKMYLTVDKFYAGKLKDYCKAIVHFGKEEKIFGIDTIRSSNGIDTEAFPLVNNQKVKGLKMIAVGKFNYWHGLDRLLKGMENASIDGTQLNIVGDGAVIPELKVLVKELQLEKKVNFCGIKRGKELNALFNQSNLGIGTLGIHRKKVAINSSLKHREYASRGLPFIYAGNDPDFEDTSWTHTIPESEDNVNLNDIQLFLSQLKTSAKEINQFAKENLSWEIKLRRILENHITN